MQRLKPLNDFIFGKTFGEKGDEEQLLSLLNAILAKTKHKKLVNIEIVEHRTFTAEVVGDKTSILDIRAVAEDGTRINIEVQLRDYGNMDRRSLFYWSREFASGLDKGDDYSQLANVIAINIVNFEAVSVDAAIYKANEKLTFLANDKEVLRLYNMREMAQIDYNSGMRKAKDEGKIEGKIEIARNMKTDGEPIEKIVRYTGLTRERIENLKI